MKNAKVPSTGEIFFAGSGVGFFSTVKKYGQIVKTYKKKKDFQIFKTKDNKLRETSTK